MIIIVTILHVVIAIFLILTVLLQAGKGAGIGAAFGGSSDTMMGVRGSTGLLGKLTATAAILFMVTSLLLSYLAASNPNESIITNKAAQTEKQKNSSK
tara:strand:- start:4517 stop:4810 length:294 start_codon:yes stop_codon:yes gene_type:complete